MDQRCPRGNRPAHTTTAKTQGPSMKDPCTDEPKEKSSAPQCTEAVSSKKKRKWQQNKKNANATEPIGGSGNANRNSKKCKQGPEKDLSHITCFNCDQKGHYQKNQKPQEEGRTLCIMQANVGRGGSANDLASALAFEEGIDILLIQEPWIGTDFRKKTFYKTQRLSGLCFGRRVQSDYVLYGGKTHYDTAHREETRSIT